MPAIRSGRPAARAAAIAAAGPLSGCERAKKASGAPGPGSLTGQADGSSPWWIVAA